MYKKFFLILLMVVFIFSASSIAFGAADILYGDLNEDGRINSVDATLLSRHILEIGSIYNNTVADLDGNGEIDSADYSLLKRYILGYINEFPVETATSVNGEINLGDSITYSGNGINVDGSTVTISTGGGYEVSGRLEDGMILVDSTEEVSLFLNNVDITNLNGPAIYFANASKAKIILEKGTVNSLTDGSINIYDTEETKAEGALVSNASLDICGKGTLNVTANYDQGIISYSNLYIEGGIINIVSNETDGIHAKEYIVIENGNIKIDAASDGIDSKGEIYTQDSYLEIKAKKHGITSNENISMYSTEAILFTERDGFNSGGSVYLDTGCRIYIESNEEGFDIDGDVEVCGEGNNINIIDIVSTGDAFDVSGELIIFNGLLGITSTENDVFDVDGGITIWDGIFILDAGKHGLTSESDIKILNGDIDLVSKRDGFNSDMSVSIENGEINIEAGEEGFDVKGQLYVADGEIDITSFGDVFDISGDIFIEGGNFNLKSTSGEDDGMDSGGSITINGGTFAIEAGKDGITADSNITIEDGIFNINSGSDGLDAGEYVSIENGTFLIVADNDGIKGNDVVINGGEIDVTSIAETLDGKNSININGGNIKLISKESSAIYMRELGVVIIDGGYTIAIGAESAEPDSLIGGIECDPNNFAITGGTLISVGRMNTEPTAQLTTQCIVSLEGASANSTISIEADSGEILNFTSPKDFQSMLFTSSELLPNKEYNLYIDGVYKRSFSVDIQTY